MRQPAITPDGTTYEYDAICEWIKEKHTDPNSRAKLETSDLISNRTVRSMIEDYILKGPDFLKKGSS